MILPLLIAAQAPVPTPAPAPPAPPVDWNYRVDCGIFTADGTPDRITGHFIHLNPNNASASLASATGRYPFDPPGVWVPILGPGQMVVHGRRRDTNYTYFFDLPSGRPRNGTVRVSSSQGRSGINWVATGICTVARTRAESR